MTILLRKKPLPQVVRQIVQRDNGAWFDPEDMSTMFQDSAGTTPVTALEQPVGLWLDKSYGLELGPDTFAGGIDVGSSGYSIYNSTQNSWTLTRDALGAGGVSSVMVLKENTGFYVEFDFTRNGPQAQYAIDIRIATGVVGVQGYSYLNAPNGHYRAFVKTGATPSKIEFRMPNAGYCGTFANISVREIKGNHATQSITASRPTLSARKNILLATEALATQSVITLAATYTLSFTGTGSVTLSGTSTGTLTGNGTDRVSLTFTPTAGTLTLTVSGSVTKAQLELGAVAGPYQRVTTSTNYDGTAAPKSLRFDGIDDYLNLPYMGLYANGSASCVSVLSTSPAATQRIIHEASTLNVAPWYGLIRFSSGSIGVAIVDDSGSVIVGNGGAFGGYYIPKIISTIDTGLNARTLINSSIVDSDNYSRSGRTVTLNTTAIGASVSLTTTGFLNGNITGGLIITKSALSDTDRRRCEQFLASRLSTLGVTLS